MTDSNNPSDNRPPNTYTTREIAAMIGSNANRVAVFCREGRLRAWKSGHDWVIQATDQELADFVEGISKRRTRWGTGRPRKG
jgi:hypothetical protein